MTTRLTLAMCAATLLSILAPAQETRLSKEWPALSAKDGKALQKLIGRLRHKKPEVATKASDAIRKLGPAAAPPMIRRLTDNKVNDNEAITAILTDLVAPEHAALIAKEIKSRKLVVRRFASLRLAMFADARTAEAMEKAATDKDEEVAFRGSLGLLALGRAEAVGAVLKRAASDWRENEAHIVAATKGHKNQRVAKELVHRLAKENAAGKIAALRLLRETMPREMAGHLAFWLDNDEASIRKETINTLRVVVDGKPPLKRISVFQAIELAKKWKERL